MTNVKCEVECDNRDFGPSPFGFGIRFPRLPTQRQLLARRFILRPGSERDRLCARGADEELVEHAALLRAIGEGQASD